MGIQDEKRDPWIVLFGLFEAAVSLLAIEIILDLELGVLSFSESLFEFIHRAREDNHPTHGEFHLAEEVSFEDHTMLGVFQFFFEKRRPLRYVHNIFMVDSVMREYCFVFVGKSLVVLYFPLELFPNLMGPVGFSHARCSRHHED
jgi:hypothetical protein